MYSNHPFTQIKMLKLRHTDSDLDIEAGVDEAGRGCLWGPLYAAATVWPPMSELSDEQKALLPQIRDSKKVSEKRRTLLAAQIQELALDWAIGIVEPAEIDELGMTKANQLAFKRALDGLQVEPERLILDGCLSVYEPPWSMKEQVVQPEADGTYIPVAAASILAKTLRDAWVTDFCEKNTNLAETYDLAKNKGYGTLKHRTGILQSGATSLHRKLFLRKLFAQTFIQQDAKELSEPT